MRLVQRYNYDPSEQQSSTSSTLETSSNQENTSQSTPAQPRKTATKRLTEMTLKYGKDGYLDLMQDVVPRRCEKQLKLIRRKMGLHLTPLATNEEKKWLLDISKCKSTTAIERVLREMYDIPDLSAECKYIRLCLASVQPLFESDQLAKNHGEDWYRLHVYYYI